MEETPKKIEDTLLKEHLKMIETHYTKPINTVWIKIHSETESGTLTSYIDPETLKVRHEWD